jgi:hypothetical protein
MSRSRVHLASLALLAFARLSAAGTLTVGPAGSGAQFTEIQAAIDAAVDDDVILVAPGTYQHITVSKPLRILGDGTGVVRIGATQFGARIQGIGAGRELVLSGIEVSLPDDSDAISLDACAGTVVLSDVDVPGGDFHGVGVHVQTCARAVLLDCQISGALDGALSALDSEVWVANSTLEGRANEFDSAGAGARLENSTLHAWNSAFVGGDAIILSPKFAGPGGVGILLLHSSADLFGGPGSEIRGGHGEFDSAINFSHRGGSGLFLFHSSARVQASIPISGGLDGLGNTTSPAIDGDATSSPTFDGKIFPTLVASAQEVALGSAFSLTLNGNPGGYQVLFLSLRTGPTTTYPRVDGLGLLNRPTMVKVASEVLPPSGVYTLGLHVPNNVALLGSTMFFQAAEKLPNASILPSSGSVSTANKFAIGNPVLVTITR